MAHANTSCGSGFTIKIASAGEVIQGGFERKFIIRTATLLARVIWNRPKILTLHNVGRLRGLGRSFRLQTIRPKSYQLCWPVGSGL